jgi:hypothetical protein
MAKNFVNKAKRRKTPSCKKDFNAMAGKLALAYARADDPDGIALRAWNKYVPLSPKTAFNILTRDLPPQTELTIKFRDKHGNGLLNIECDDLENDTKWFSDSRDFELRWKKADTGCVDVNDFRAGQGTGRILMRNQIEFFHACGVRKFKILAASRNGGYTWARMGFLPETPDSPSFKRGTKDVAGARLEMVRPYLPPETYDRVKALLEFSKKHDMWRVADQDTDLVPLLAPVLAPDEENDDAPLAELRRVYEDAWQKAVDTGRSLPLGRALLSGTMWSGALDMDSKRQMKRIARYTGGWKYIAPA